MAKKLMKAQAGKIVKGVVKAAESAKKYVPSPGLNITTKTATRVPATRGRVVGYSKDFKNKYNNAVNAAFLGAMGAGAAASGVFDNSNKKPINKPVSKSDTLKVKKKMGGLVKSKSKK
jgi:hypothetical protein